MKRLIEAPDLTKKKKLKEAPDIGKKRQFGASLSLMPNVVSQEPQSDTENIKNLQDAVSKITTTLTDVLLRLKNTDRVISNFVVKDRDSINRSISDIQTELVFIKKATTEQDIKEVTQKLSLLMERVVKFEQDIKVTDVINEDLKTVHKTLEDLYNNLNNVINAINVIGTGRRRGVSERYFFGGTGGAIVSSPPAEFKKVTNLYVEPVSGSLIVIHEE